MTTTRVLICAAALLACGHALAQTGKTSAAAPTVYKCTGADGNIVFSGAPCPDTYKSQKVDTSAALRTGSGGHNEELAASVSDSDCRRNAQPPADPNVNIDESNRHIADYQQRQRELAAQKIYAPDGSGNLIADPSAQKTIADLDAAIAKERSFQQNAQVHATAKYEAALKACDKAAAKNAQPAGK
jgi:hypothetical protein